VRQKRSPYLPLNRILVLAEEVLKLQRLFKLLEEQFNLPPCLVEFRTCSFALPYTQKCGRRFATLATI
jgi:hypothetical protein